MNDKVIRCYREKDDHGGRSWYQSNKGWSVYSTKVDGKDRVILTAKSGESSELEKALKNLIGSNVIRITSEAVQSLKSKEWNLMESNLQSSDALQVLVNVSALAFLSRLSAYSCLWPIPGNSLESSIRSFYF